MKFFAALALALFLAIPAARAQQSPDDQYVIIYVLIQQGDAYVNSGQAQQALGEYVEAQRELEKFQKVYSDWNPQIVNYRLKYLADRIQALTPQAAPANASPVNVPPPTPADWQSQLTSLNAQVQKLQGDNGTLQAKLKEALGVQPVEVSADAYAQLQEQARELAKENDLLKASLAQATNAPAVEPSSGGSGLAAALAEQTARANQIAQQNQALQAQVATLTTSAQDEEALREENALLKKQLASLSASPAVAQVQPVQSDETINWLEKTALENRLRQWQEASLNSAAVDTSAGGADLQSQIAELKLERDSLLAQLGEANKKNYGRNNQPAAAQVDSLAQQVETLQARVAVDEAQVVPYTPQELALFTPQSLTANPNADQKSIRDLPNGAAVLVAEAQSYFTNREYDQAAADYQKILKSDPDNALALANLAAIEVEENKIAEADKHIQAALVQQPNDPFNLTVLGRIKFTEGNNDAALDALDRAAKLDPQNPQIENFLGVALAQKGLRVQAETAFRKAVQIDPNYADAHKNLAIIYLSANPPMVELARWHYEKALAAGMPPSPELEKMLSADTNQH